MDQLGFSLVSLEPPRPMGAEEETQMGEITEQGLAPVSDELEVDRRATPDASGLELTDEQLQPVGGASGSEPFEIGGAKAEALDEVMEICDGAESVEGGLSSSEAYRSSVSDVTVHDLRSGHLLAVGSVVLGDGDNDENRAEVVGFAARTVDTSDDLGFGSMNQEMETEIGVLVHSVQGMHLKDSVSQAFTVGTSESIQGEGSIVLGEETQNIEPMKPVDEARTNTAAAVQKDSCPGDPVVQVENRNSPASGDDQKEITDFEIHGLGCFTGVTVAEALGADGHLTNVDSMGTGEFVETDVRSANVAISMEPKSTEIQPVNEVTVAKTDTSPVDLGSAPGVQSAKSESAESYMHLVVEDPNDKDDVVLENSVLVKEVQDPDAGSHESTLLEKGDFSVAVPNPAMDTSVPEASLPFEIQNLASQGKESLGSVSGALIAESRSGDTLLTAENPNYKADIVLENSVPAKEVQDEDIVSLNNTLLKNGDFAVTDPNSVVDISVPETSLPFEVQNLTSQGKEVLGSVSGALIAEPQIGDTDLVVEDHNHKADIVLENLVLLKEALDADVGPLDNTLLEKGDFSVTDLKTVVDTSVPEASVPFEIQRPASQAKVSIDFPLGDSQMAGIPSLGSLADESPQMDAHTMEPSPSRNQTDMGPNVLNYTISPLDECCNEVKGALPEAEQQTKILDDGVSDLTTYAGTSHIEEQGLLEGADNQILDSVAMTPWTLYVQNIERVRYHLPPQVSTELSISDLVWGKVKSHPWWPGQIVDPFDASEMALKHQKKDNFLVAYFGDRTFAWRDTFQLKPFYTNFSQMEKQSSSEAFIYAVNDSLEEASRRAELGLTCSCVPEEDYADIKYKKTENAGIRKAIGATSFDRSLIMNQFQPERLIEYIRALAQSPTGGAHRLDLGIAQAQLKAFYRSKGYPELPQFMFGGWLLENDIEASFYVERKPVEDIVDHSTPMPSELIPVKRKRGRPPKNQKLFLESGGLRENVVEISSFKVRKPMEPSVEHSTPRSSELIPVKRKRGRPPKNQKRILEDVGKQFEVIEEKNISNVVSGSGRESRLKAVIISGSCSSGKRSKFDIHDFADIGKKKKKKLDSLQDIENSTSPLTLNHSFESREGLDGSWKSKKERGDSSGDFQAKSPSSTISSSFKIGEYIRRVASKLTGSPPILRCQGETFQKSASGTDYSKVDINNDAFPCTPVWNKRKKKGLAENYSTPDEMLYQLCLAARNPLKRYSFVSLIVSFFTKFRNSIASNSSEDSKDNERIGSKRGRKRTFNSHSDSSDMSKPDYMKDSYWNDVISDNSSERRLLSNGLKRKRGTDIEKRKKRRKSAGLLSPSLLLGSVTDTTQQLQFGALNMKPALGTERSIIRVEEKIMDTPTALVLSFISLHSLPSETDLIRIFSRYGPLKEEETEVLRKSNRVKVVFKRRADAEIAFSSAGKFSIFGPDLLSYRLRYLTSMPKTSPDTSPDGKHDAIHTENGNLELSEPKGSLDVSLVGNEDTTRAENDTFASGNFLLQGNDDEVPAEYGNFDASVPLTTSDTSPEAKNDAVPTEGGDIEVSVQAETVVFDTTEVEAVGQG